MPSRSRREFAVMWEALLVVGALHLAAYLRLGTPGIWPPELAFLTKVAVVTTVWLTCLYFSQLYEPRTGVARQLMVVNLGRALAAAMLVLSVTYFWVPELALGRGVFAIAILLLPYLALLQRAVLDRLWSTTGRERVLVVGTNDRSVRIARELHGQTGDTAIQVVGFVDPDPARVGTPMFNPSIVASFGDLGGAVARLSANRVAISAACAFEEMSLDEVVRLRVDGVSFEHLSSIYEEYTGKLAIEELTPMSIMSTGGFRRHSWQLAAKRASDIAAALAGMVLALPLMLLTAAVIKLTSPGPVLYRQERVGEFGRVFTMLKFRSMRDHAEDETGPVWASAGDGRVTWIGRILRISRFDEVPQLWNVLRGEMSFVGPRPERPEFDEMLMASIPLYRERRLVRPGITGWAQVRHHYTSSVEDAQVKLQYDLFYVKNMSFSLDLLIVLSTFGIVLRGGGAR